MNQYIYIYMSKYVKSQKQSNKIGKSCHKIRKKTIDQLNQNFRRRKNFSTLACRCCFDVFGWTMWLRSFCCVWGFWIFCRRECENVLRFLMVDGSVSPCLWLFSGIRRQEKLSFIFITTSFFLLSNASSIGKCEFCESSFFSGVSSNSFTCGSKSKLLWSKTRCIGFNLQHIIMYLWVLKFSAHILKDYGRRERILLCDCLSR